VSEVKRFWCTCLAAIVLIPSTTEAALIVGRVVDAAGRAPVVARVDVVAVCGDSPCGNARQAAAKTHSAATGTDGSFRIQLPADWPPSEIRISSVGLCTIRPADLVSGATDLDVGVITLPTAQTLRGVVQDEFARPIAGAHVMAMGLDGRGDLLPGEAYTDGNGRYLISDAPERVGQMSVTHADYVPQAAPRTRDSWKLKPGGTVQGVIMDDQHRPAAEARIAARGHSVLSEAFGRFTLSGLSRDCVRGRIRRERSRGGHRPRGGRSRERFSHPASSARCIAPRNNS
jgi:hypothetical protein